TSTLSLHDALPISPTRTLRKDSARIERNSTRPQKRGRVNRSRGEARNELSLSWSRLRSVCVPPLCLHAGRTSECVLPRRLTLILFKIMLKSRASLTDCGGNALLAGV